MLNHLQTVLRPFPDQKSAMTEDHFEYDLVTIGAGSAGVRASRVAASKYGKKASHGGGVTGYLLGSFVCCLMSILGC